MTDDALPTPGYQKRYFCGECPRHLQPADGFWLTEFAGHQHSHVHAALCEASRDASECRESLIAIDHFLCKVDFAEWPPRSVRLVLKHWVDMGLRRHDDAYFKEKEKTAMAEATTANDAWAGKRLASQRIQEALLAPDDTTIELMARAAHTRIHDEINAVYTPEDVQKYAWENIEEWQRDDLREQARRSLKALVATIFTPR